MPHLELTLCDGRTVELSAPADGVEKELRAFLERNGRYEQTWIKLSEDEYVRYSEITRVKVTR